MAKHSNKAVGKVAGKCLRNADAKESAMLRNLRIDGSQNGATLRTRVVRDKTKYNRNVKHKKSFADARDFAFIGLLSRKWSEDALGIFCDKALRAFVVFVAVIYAESIDGAFFVVIGVIGLVASAK